MHKVRVLIVEDEIFIGQDLKMRLQELGFEISGMAMNIESAIPFLDQKETDICLLDIQLKGEKDGIHLAHLINLHYPMPIIFITSYQDEITVSRAKDTQPAAYILKPFNDFELQMAIDLALENYTNNKTAQISEMAHQKRSNIQTHILPKDIFIRKKDRLIRLGFEDILWIEAQSNYSVISCQEQQFILSITLGKVKEKLPTPPFFRANRSFVINLNQVEAIVGNAIMIKGNLIGITKPYREQVFENFNIL